MTADERAAMHELHLRFERAVPHNRALGLRVVTVGDARSHFVLPYAEHLVGNPETGVLHGGAISAAMDAACGAAVFQALLKPMVIATLDLRIDYLRAAEPRADLFGMAECYKLTHNVAFVRGSAWDRSAEDPFASMLATFMIVGPLNPASWQNKLSGSGGEGAS